MSKPVLHVFAISHFCEKARWALDYLGIDYDVAYLAPGVHMRVAKQLGARHSSLPILTLEGQTVQGSAAILTWAEAAAGDNKNRLMPVPDSGEGREIEQRLDDVAGVHVRRYYYSEALVEHPRIVRPVFMTGLPPMQKLQLLAGWRVIRQKMIQLMDLGPKQGRESRGIVEAEMDWLDELLSDGRPFLAGDAFSRTDIAAASLLAPLAQPPEHPVYTAVMIPPRIAADLEKWRQRPTIQWVRRTYAHRRLPQPE